MAGGQDDDSYPPDEAARRRDEVVKRMLSTPPQPHRPIRRDDAQRGTEVAPKRKERSRK